MRVSKAFVRKRQWVTHVANKEDRDSCLVLGIAEIEVFLDSCQSGRANLQRDINEDAHPAREGRLSHFDDCKDAQFQIRNITEEKAAPTLDNSRYTLQNGTTISFPHFSRSPEALTDNNTSKDHCVQFQSRFLSDLVALFFAKGCQALGKRDAFDAHNSRPLLIMIFTLSIFVLLLAGHVQ